MFAPNLLVFDPRERRMNQLLSRGYATTTEILKADFGEWPPKGLDIDFQPGDMVWFRSLLSDAPFPKLTKLDYIIPNLKIIIKNGSSSKGYIYNDKPDEIFLNNPLFLLSRLLGPFGCSGSSTTGHENIHILQENYRDLKNINEKASDFFDRETTSSPDLLPLPSFAKGEKLNYLRKGIEIQARMHQLLSDGYPAWGAMPTTRHELWAAMASQGMKLPSGIRQQLETTPVGQRAQKIFGKTTLKGKIIENSAAFDLNIIARSTRTAKGQEMFWRRLMPEIYGDLLEMYGDKQGKKRMRPAVKPEAQNKIDGTVKTPYDNGPQCINRTGFRRSVATLKM